MAVQRFHVGGSPKLAPTATARVFNEEACPGPVQREDGASLHVPKPCTATRIP